MTCPKITAGLAFARPVPRTALDAEIPHMTFGRTDPGGQSGQPLLFWPVRPAHGVICEQPPTPTTGVATQGWELIDPCGSREESSAATAATRRLGRVVCLVDVAVAPRLPTAPPDA